jgi:hypothetical protein
MVPSSKALTVSTELVSKECLMKQIRELTVLLIYSLKS